MKKLILITAMLFLLSGCVVIDSKYTGRSRMRINTHRQYVYYSAPMPYCGWVYVPYGYCGWYGNYDGWVYPRKQTPAVVKKTITKRQLKKVTYTSTRRVVKAKNSTSIKAKISTKVKKK